MYLVRLQLYVLYVLYTVYPVQYNGYVSPQRGVNNKEFFWMEVRIRSISQAAETTHKKYDYDSLIQRASHDEQETRSCRIPLDLIPLKTGLLSTYTTTS